MKRFVIFGQANSGSEILHRALNTHPDILAAGEIFHYIPEKRREDYQRSCGFSGRDYEIYAMNGDLDGYFYNPAWKYGGGFKSLGFTLLYEHCCLAWAHAELAIERNESIIIIDIRHKNPFDLMVKWWKQNGAAKVHISPEAAKRWLEVRIAWLGWLEDRRETHQIVEIDDNELLMNYHSVLAKLFEHLGVATEEIIPPRLPLNRSLETLSEIENLNELRRWFTNSHWEQYLYDQVDYYAV